MSEIIAELQRRHDAGKATGDDAFFRDVKDLISTLTAEVERLKENYETALRRVRSTYNQKTRNYKKLKQAEAQISTFTAKVERLTKANNELVELGCTVADEEGWICSYITENKKLKASLQESDEYASAYYEQALQNAEGGNKVTAENQALKAALEKVKSREYMCGRNYSESFSSYQIAKQALKETGGKSNG
jgi:DNA repair exonuclease SbcCD ATPase subunit